MWPSSTNEQIRACGKRVAGKRLTPDAGTPCEVALLKSHWYQNWDCKMTLQTSSMLKTHGHTVLLMANVVECSATHSELILLTSICCTMTHQTSCLLNTYQNKCMRSNILRAHRKVTWRISFYGKTTTQTWHMSNTHTGHVFFWHQSFSAKCQVMPDIICRKHIT